MKDLDFQTSASFDRKLFWSAGQSVRYLVVRVRANAVDDNPRRERTPLHTVLVIDASGSMADGKLEAAKEAAMGMVDKLTPRDRVTVVSFASEVQVHLSGMQVTPENVKLIRSEVRRLQTRGMTNLHGGWMAGADIAKAIAQEGGPIGRLIILSDGHANVGVTAPDQLREYAQELKAHGVLTSTLGIGNGYDEQLLLAISESGGGRLHDAELTTEISSVLLGELDDIQGTVVEDWKVAVTHPTRVQVDLVGTSPTEHGTGKTTCSLGPIQDRIERVAVFKVVCPEVQDGDTLTFEVASEGVTSERVRVEASPVTASLVAANSTVNDGQRRDRELAGIVTKLWSAHVLTVVAKLNRDGQYDEAQNYAARELAHFRRYAQNLPGGEALIKRLAMLARRAGRVWRNPRLAQEMVFRSSMVKNSIADHRGKRANMLNIDDLLDEDS